jgi:Flp pilus assembly protein TadG
MRTQGLAALRSHRRAVAAVEFALVAPVLALVLVGAIDYGFREWSRSCLANAVAQGAYYAFLSGPNVSGTTVQTLVQNASPLTGVTVTVNPPTAAACYCPSGSPAALGPQVTSCTTACTDGTTPGTYLKISATYTQTPWIPIPFYSGLNNQSTITETATVRLQ